MFFADAALSKRLERAEGFACREFAEARRRLFPDSGSEWIECAGAYAVFDGVGAPTTQTFGLGLFEELEAASLEMMEKFFKQRHAVVNHEVSPHVGVAALDLLCSRGYKPLELSNVMFRSIEAPQVSQREDVRVRVTGEEEAELWADISSRGWTHEHPELVDFLKGMGVICAARKGSPCFLAEFDGQPGAAGVLSIHEGVALFAGAATVPELRRRGLQNALLEARMQYAFEQGCDLAMMVTEIGSDSQRNAQRQGFQVGYTRVKWQLSP
jgi:GNAT superfamily N-acetyltransferase